MTEITYTPTPEEYERARHPSEELKLSGDGIFATYQGEGVSAGRPSVFIRLQNCNLHCGRDGQGWVCDAGYTWDTTTPEYWKETRLASIEKVAGEIRDSWSSNFSDVDLPPNLVMTGGEPLLQQPKLAGLMSLLPDWQFEVETNGTISPSEAFKDVQINCSPKLESSGNPLIARRREKALQDIAKFPNYWLKFVIAQPEDIEEVKTVVNIANCGDFSRVLLMNEGVVAKELSDKDIKLAKVAESLGCTITARNHIFWFGDKRAT